MLYLKSYIQKCMYIYLIEQHPINNGSDIIDCLYCALLNCISFRMRAQSSSFHYCNK